MNWIKREVTIVYSTHRKWGVALLALAATAVNQGLLHGSALHYTQIAVAAAAALGVRAVPNAVAAAAALGVRAVPNDAPGQPLVAVSPTLPSVDVNPAPTGNVTVVPPPDPTLAEGT